MIFFEKFLNKQYGALSVAWSGVLRTGPLRTLRTVLPGRELLIHLPISSSRDHVPHVPQRGASLIVVAVTQERRVSLCCTAALLCQCVIYVCPSICICMGNRQQR